MALPCTVLAFNTRRNNYPKKPRKSKPYQVSFYKVEEAVNDVTPLHIERVVALTADTARAEILAQHPTAVIRAAFRWYGGFDKRHNRSINLRTSQLSRSSKNSRMGRTCACGCGVPLPKFKHLYATPKCARKEKNQKQKANWQKRHDVAIAAGRNPCENCIVRDAQEGRKQCAECDAASAPTPRKYARKNLLKKARRVFAPVKVARSHANHSTHFTEGKRQVVQTALEMINPFGVEREGEHLGVVGCADGLYAHTQEAKEFGFPLRHIWVVDYDKNAIPPLKAEAKQVGVYPSHIMCCDLEKAIKMFQRNRVPIGLLDADVLKFSREEISLLQAAKDANIPFIMLTASQRISEGYREKHNQLAQEWGCVLREPHVKYGPRMVGGKMQPITPELRRENLPRYPVTELIEKVLESMFGGTEWVVSYPLRYRGKGPMVSFVIAKRDANTGSVISREDLAKRSDPEYYSS